MLNVRMNVNMDYFFFFQAEDGIRDYKVTGVQTCALPILRRVTGTRVLVLFNQKTTAMVTATMSIAPIMSTKRTMAMTIMKIQFQVTNLIRRDMMQGAPAILMISINQQVTPTIQNIQMAIHTNALNL